MTLIYSLLLVLFLPASPLAQISFFPDESSLPPPCTTPDNLPGECIVLTKCRPLLVLIKRPVSPKIRRLLRASVCGFNGKFPDVCCPKLNNQLIENIKTTTTTTTTTTTATTTTTTTTT